jgi:hypothetical protein
MAEGVHARVLWVEPVSVDSVFDHPARQAELEQLPARDATVLPSGEIRGRPIDVTRYGSPTTIVVNPQSATGSAHGWR